MFDFYGVLASFLLIHLLCDFYLQPDSWIAAKKARTYRAWQLYAHALLHGIGLIIPAVIIGLSWSSVACMVLIVSTSHFVIDWWKVSVNDSDRFAYWRSLVPGFGQFRVAPCCRFRTVSDEKNAPRPGLSRTVWRTAGRISRSSASARFSRAAWDEAESAHPPRRLRRRRW